MHAKATYDMLWYAFNQNGYGERWGRGGFGGHIVAAIEELDHVNPIVLVQLATSP